MKISKLQSDSRRWFNRGISAAAHLARAATFAIAVALSVKSVYAGGASVEAKQALSDSRLAQQAEKRESEESKSGIEAETVSKKASPPASSRMTGGRATPEAVLDALERRIGYARERLDHRKSSGILSPLQIRELDKRLKAIEADMARARKNGDGVTSNLRLHRELDRFQYKMYLYTMTDEEMLEERERDQEERETRQATPELRRHE